MRRLVVSTVVVLFIMAAMMALGPPMTSPSAPPTIAVGPASASAQVPGQTKYCGPWHQDWNVSQAGWWYF